MVMNKVIEKIKAKGENLCLLEGMERLEYLLEQSKNSRPMAQEHKTEVADSSGVGLHDHGG